MATGEDQLEPFVFDHGVVDLVFGGLGQLEQMRLGGERALAADPVDRPVARGGVQPAARVGRNPFGRPALRGDRERVLGGILGEVEVAEEADQVGDDTPPLVAEDRLDRQLTCPTIGRTSTEPP
jgi:hypothetical protein